MATRLLSTAVKPRSDPTIKRLISYTIEKLQIHQQVPDDSVNQEKGSVKQTEESEPGKDTQRDHDEDDNDAGQGYEFVNKETGEVGGPRGPEPTRYGDWEKGGRCCDF